MHPEQPPSDRLDTARTQLHHEVGGFDGTTAAAVISG